MLAWRGFVRVIFPRITVPTSGRRFPVVRVMEVVGSLEVLFGLEERMGPAMLAWSWSFSMCVPEPRSLALVDPMVWPGRASPVPGIMVSFAGAELVKVKLKFKSRFRFRRLK